MREQTSEPAKRSCRECGERSWHLVECPLNTEGASRLYVSDSERVPEPVPNRHAFQEPGGGLVGCFKAHRGQPKDATVHAAPQKDEAESLGVEAQKVYTQPFLRAATRIVKIFLSPPADERAIKSVAAIMEQEWNRAAPTSAQKLGCAAHGFKFREGCDACESTASAPAGPELKQVVQKFLDDEWCGVLNEYQRRHIAKEIEFQWELAKLRATHAPTEPSVEPTIRVRAQWFIDHEKDQHLDHACFECTGDEATKRHGFTCYFHQAVAAVREHFQKGE